MNQKIDINMPSIIKGVKIYKNLKSVLGNFDLVIATSNRKRFLNKPSIKNFDNIFDIFPMPKTTNIVTRIAVIILFISKEFIYIYSIRYHSYNMLVVKKLKYLIIQFASLRRINYQ